MTINNNFKGIFFDFDGVITLEKQGTPTIVSYLSEQTQLPYATVDAAYRRYNRQLLRGDITHREMWAPFCEELGKTLPYAMLEKSFLNVHFDPNVLSYIRRKKTSCLIGMITNNKADRIEAILRHTQLRGLFDLLVISANVRCMKPERGIYEAALQMSGLRAQECVFVDNTAANLKAPAEMGFTTCYFDDEARRCNGLPF